MTQSSKRKTPPNNQLTNKPNKQTNNRPTNQTTNQAMKNNYKGGKLHRMERKQPF